MWHFLEKISLDIFGLFFGVCAKDKSCVKFSATTKLQTSFIVLLLFEKKFNFLIVNGYLISHWLTTVLHQLEQFWMGFYKITANFNHAWHQTRYWQYTWYSETNSTKTMIEGRIFFIFEMYRLSTINLTKLWNSNDN